ADVDDIAAEGRSHRAAGDGRRRRRVVDLVVRGDAAHGQSGRGDVGSEGTRRRRRVVAAVAATERDAGQGDPAPADVLAAEGADRRTVDRHVVVAERLEAGAAGQGCDGGAVI